MTVKTRRPLVAGNWKMNGLGANGVALARDVVAGAAGLARQGGPPADGSGGAAAGAGSASGPAPSPAVDVVVCPPFTLLGEVGRAVAGTSVELGAQNVHWEDKGAFTGEISGPMLVELGCRYVIIGHSERRQHFGETDATVRKRLAAALRHSLRPIVCVGETWEEREAGRTEERVGTQLLGALAGACSDSAGGAPPGSGDLQRDLSIAYEPVWAIGSGRAASGRDAQEVAAYIRRVLSEILGAEAAARTRILYGGSVKPENMAEFAGQPDIDGALVGGASLDAEAFCGIVRQVVR